MRWLIVATIVATLARYGHTKRTEDEAGEFYRNYNVEAQSVIYTSSVAAWNYATNITDTTSALKVNASLVDADFNLAVYRNATEFEWENFENKTLLRLFSRLVDIGSDALGLKDKDKLKQLRVIESTMESIYSSGKVVLPGTTKELKLEPDLTEIMSKSRDYQELLEAWKGWRDVVGRAERDHYIKFIALSNEASRENGHANTADSWISNYEMPIDDFKALVARLYEELLPLYEQLHAFVRRKLIGVYGEDNFPKSRHIPAHLLGNMWAQSWNNLQDLVVPFKNKTSVDVTPEMIRQNYTARRMFNVSEEFFTSLGLSEMPDLFWKTSMLTRPADGREVVCHASAWDFYNQKDFRIKMCTDINMEDLITIHHEMGHIQYYLQYKDQPVDFRRGANPGFHEAVGDVLALSVATPNHLKKIGLLQNVETDNEADLNYLLSIALDKIAFLPFGYLMDNWRWSLFTGETPTSQMNAKWWELRKCTQGISPPIERNETDFDPGAKYHIPANTPYIRYFVSFVLQFQLHEALCKIADPDADLHKCDIYQSKEAGEKLSAMLKLGSSVPWPDALKQITGTEKLSATSLVSYFKPLIDWLKEQNKGYDVTWDKTGCPTKTTSGASAIKISSTVILLTISYLNLA